MVVHPAPGNPTGTLVNAFLHHCHLPPVSVEPHPVADDSSGAYSAAQPVHKSPTAWRLLVYPLFLFFLLICRRDLQDLLSEFDGANQSINQSINHLKSLCQS